MKVFNGHSDLFLKIYEDFLEGSGDSLQNYQKEFQEGNIDTTVMVLYIDENATDYPNYLEEMGKVVLEALKNNQSWLHHVQKAEDLKKQGPKVLVGMEGMKGLKEPEDLYTWKDKLYLAHGSLTWNEENDYASGASIPSREGGLTSKGRKVLKIMETLGLVIDLSHLNDKSTRDVLLAVHGPVIASHSNARALQNVPRNLPDEFIKAIADTGGVIGVNAIRSFLSEKRELQNIDGFLRHLDYMVNLVGVEHVGLGFDFTSFLKEYRNIDTDHEHFPSPKDLYREGQIPKLLHRMEEMGFHKEEVEQIAYGNFQRVFSSVLKS